MDLKDLAERLGLAENEYMDLVRLFIDTSAAELENLKSAILNRSQADALSVAHSLKGAALSMKLREFSETATAMETAIRNSQWPAAEKLSGQFSELLADLIWAIR